MAIFPVSCSTDASEIENSQKVLEFSQSVNTENVFHLVEQIYQLHLSDTPVDNQGFPPDELFPSDHLTRDSAVGFVAGELSMMGYEVDTVVCGTQHPVAYNVVAELKGMENPNSVILIGCHLDAFYGGADISCLDRNWFSKNGPGLSMESFGVCSIFSGNGICYI